MHLTHHSASGGGLAAALLRGVLEDCHTYQEGNTDYLRLGLSGARRLLWRARDRALAVAAKAGFTRRRFEAEGVRGRTRYLLEHIDEFESALALLADEESKSLFVELLKFRVLGAEHVRLRRNNERFWQQYRDVDRRYAVERGTQRVWQWPLHRYRLPGRGGSIELQAHTLNILDTFVLEQYAWRRPAWPAVEVREGDVVIDGGACWGDTTLYFADRAGAAGKVYAFELMPENLELLRRNLARNAELAARVEVLDRALWSVSDESIPYAANGPGTTVGGGEADAPAERTAVTLSVDDLVARRALPRVDFLKLDVEGAELEALRGAEQSIRRFRPRLAVSLYHRKEDFAAIPRYLAELDAGYRFHLDHFTIHDEETMLFASPME